MESLDVEQEEAHIVSRIEIGKLRTRARRAPATALKADPMARRKLHVGGGSLAGLEAEIFNSIRAAIVEQRLPPGTKLTEDGIGEIYAVSRARIRRVLLSLSHEKVVDLLPGRGSFVATPLPLEARDVFAARRLVEIALLSGLKEPPSALILAELRQLVAAERAATQRQDRPEAIRLSGEFHVTLARRLGNGVIAELLKGLVSRSSLIIAMYESSGNACCLTDDHAVLIAAMTNGRGGQAAAAMGRHLSKIEAGLDLDRRRKREIDLRQLLLPAPLNGGRSR
jgi:DNA-binding GntR family transcriptional regulator